MNAKKLAKKLLGPQLTHKIGTRFLFKEKPELKTLISPNSSLKGIHEGQRCFIFGNGPSLNNVDFSLFENEYSFTVNMLTKNPNFYKLKTNYHMWADENFFNLDMSKPEDRAILESMKNVNAGDNTPVVFYKDTAKDLIEKYELKNKLNIRYYSQGCWENWNANSKISFDEPVPGFGTVVHYCICLAVYMGFKEIYLMGCDCTGIFNALEAWIHLEDSSAQTLQYAYEVSDDDKKISQKGHLNCSVKNEFLGWVHLFEDYDKLYHYCKNNGVALFNASKPTLLQDVPRINLDSIIHK